MLEKRGPSSRRSCREVALNSRTPGTSPLPPAIPTVPPPAPSPPPLLLPSLGVLPLHAELSFGELQSAGLSLLVPEARPRPPQPRCHNPSGWGLGSAAGPAGPCLALEWCPRSEFCPVHVPPVTIRGGGRSQGANSGPAGSRCRTGSSAGRPTSPSSAPVLPPPSLCSSHAPRPEHPSFPAAFTAVKAQTPFSLQPCLCLSCSHRLTSRALQVLSRLQACCKVCPCPSSPGRPTLTPLGQG